MRTHWQPRCSVRLSVTYMIHVCTLYARLQWNSVDPYFDLWNAKAANNILTNKRLRPRGDWKIGNQRSKHIYDVQFLWNFLPGVLTHIFQSKNFFVVFIVPLFNKTMVLLTRERFPGDCICRGTATPFWSSLGNGGFRAHFSPLLRNSMFQHVTSPEDL